MKCLELKVSTQLLTRKKKLTVAEGKCKKSTAKHSPGKSFLLNFVNLSKIFSPRLLITFILLSNFNFLSFYTNHSVHPLFLHRKPPKKLSKRRRGGGEGLTGSQFLEGVCITVSGIILASENVSLETKELLPF